MSYSLPDVEIAWRVPLDSLTEAIDLLERLMVEPLYPLFCALADNCKCTTAPGYDAVRAIARMIEGEDAIIETRGVHFYCEREFAYLVPFGYTKIEVPDWFEFFGCDHRIASSRVPEEQKGSWKKWQDIKKSKRRLFDVTFVSSNVFTEDSEIIQESPLWKMSERYYAEKEGQNNGN